MTLESYVRYLAALGVFFATPPDTSQLLVIANRARHGLRRSICNRNCREAASFNRLFTIS